MFLLPCDSLSWSLFGASWHQPEGFRSVSPSLMLLISFSSECCGSAWIGGLSHQIQLLSLLLINIGALQGPEGGERVLGRGGSQQVPLPKSLPPPNHTHPLN